MTEPPDNTDFPTISGFGKGRIWSDAESIDPKEVSPGDRIGDFTILEEVGRGGMGVVYKAYETSLKRMVALKVLNPAIAKDPSLMKRFRREAVLAANLSHPNIVPVYTIDSGERPRYFTMEYVQGISLKEKIERDGFLSPDQAVRIALQVCDALQHAHKHHIIHRDIKPSNILLENHIERVRVTDFGIAQDISGKLSDITETGSSTPGTPAFESPEQNLGQSLDERTDIFSLGMTLYYTLTGQVAYRARNRQELVVAFREQTPNPPSQYNPVVSKTLDAIIMKMIAARLDDRYADTEAVQADFKRLGTGQDGHIPATRKVHRKIKARYLVLAVFIAVIVILMAALMLLARQDSHKKTTAEREPGDQNSLSRAQTVAANSERELSAQNRLSAIQTAVSNEDYTRAKLLLHTFQKDYSDTEVCRIYSQRIDEMARDVNERSHDTNIEDKYTYILVQPPLRTRLWQSYMSQAQKFLQRSNSGGITVLRVIYEDESMETPIVKLWASFLQLTTDGYSLSSRIQDVSSGQPTFLVASEGRFDPNTPIGGTIVTGGLYHYQTALPVSVLPGKATAFGEIIVRLVPEEFRGNLLVRVEPEEGLDLTGAEVLLQPGGRWGGIGVPGVTLSCTDNSCLFGSIGPGSYSAKLVPHDDAVGSRAEQATVVTGQTREVLLHAYRHRIVEIDWRFRTLAEPTKWLKGRKSIKTTDKWDARKEGWGFPGYCVVRLSDWENGGCAFSDHGGEMMRIDDSSDFEAMEFPASINGTSGPFSLKEGDIFAWQYDSPDKGTIQALLHIRKITPVSQ